jgi:tetratricopeptide (TPR) repeat protein
MIATSGGNLDRALALAQTATRALPDSPEVSDTLGFIYYKKGLLPQAIQTLNTTVEREPSKAEYRYHLGLALAESGDTAGSARHLERALALNGNFQNASEAKTLLQELRSR